MIRIAFLVVVGLLIYRLLFGAGGRPRMPARAQLRIGIAVALALVYLRSPIDLIPDTSLFGFLDDLLFAFLVVGWAVRRARTAAPGPGEWRREAEPPRAARKSWDPYAVLGVLRGASRDQITAAYRERMKQYHPDRVSGLGEELQVLAHEKTVEIQRAYEELRNS
jgi:uncharacterized membrane protein YkvA (DUF1232 family)